MVHSQYPLKSDNFLYTCLSPKHLIHYSKVGSMKNIYHMAQAEPKVEMTMDTLNNIAEQFRYKKGEQLVQELSDVISPMSNDQRKQLYTAAKNVCHDRLLCSILRIPYTAITDTDYYRALLYMHAVMQKAAQTDSPKTI